GLVSHGSLKIQRKRPVPPLRRAPSSTEATTVKAVTRLGKTTANVRMAWSSLVEWGMPGSGNMWCNPVGIEKGINARNTRRARDSLKSLPPTWAGSIVYQEMYAGNSQK